MRWSKTTRVNWKILGPTKKRMTIKKNWIIPKSKQKGEKNLFWMCWTVWCEIVCKFYGCWQFLLGKAEILSVLACSCSKCVFDVDEVCFYENNYKWNKTLSREKLLRNKNRIALIFKYGNYHKIFWRETIFTWHKIWHLLLNLKRLNVF